MTGRGVGGGWVWMVRAWEELGGKREWVGNLGAGGK